MINSVNPFAALTNAGSNESARASITDNFDTFLQLLTTQLQNQNPLEPLDTNEFTQQLVQFTGVEQSLKTNDNLERLLQLQAATTITGAIGYIGKEVTLGSSAQQLQNGVASWPYSSTGNASEALFTIQDSNGKTVFSETRPVSGGQDTYTWGGQTTSGTQAAPGLYTLTIKALGNEAQTVTIDTSLAGTVEGVDMSQNPPVLVVDGKRVKLEDVLTVKQSGG